LADYRGKTVLLNVWATWCGPCRREMPALDAVQRERPDDLAVLFVSDEALELIHAWRADVPGEGRHLRADSDTWRGPYAAASAQRPVSFLIDAEGLLRERIVGAETAAGFRQRLRSHGI
ncbi:MAG: TlpA disulfide reductase family protein, partial [Bacteroidota bacterium]